MSNLRQILNAGNLRYDVSQDRWNWIIQDAQILTGVNTQVVIQGIDDCKLSSHNIRQFEDFLGSGSCLQLSYETAEGIRFDVSYFSYDNMPILAIEGTVSNTPANDVRLQEIALIHGNLSMGEHPPLYSVLGNGYWMGGCRLAFLDKEDETTSYWSCAIADRDSGKSLVAGIAESANVDDTIVFSRNEGTYNLRFTGICNSNRKGKPLLLKAGRSFSINRIVLVYGDDIYTGLDQYSSYVKEYMKMSPRHKPYVGLFTGYSSDPGNQIVIRLTESRVLEQLDILERTVQKYGVFT
jgi:hypothetical protein